MSEKKIRIGNILLGILTGIVISTFFKAVANLLLFYLNYKHPNAAYGWIKIAVTIIEILLFLVVIKYFLSRERSHLSMYFLFSVAAATTFVIFVVNMSAYAVRPIIMNVEFQRFFELEDAYMLRNFTYVAVLLLITVFISGFWLLANRKVKYIRYISEEVKKMETEGFGKTMKVQGNDELSELSTAINTMSVKLKEKIDQEKQLEKEKNELITNVSHDLRTPLTSIIGYVSLLKQNKCEDKEQCMEYIEVVDRRLQGLHVMINELFEYTKMTAGDFRLERSNVDLVALAGHLSYEYAILYKKAGLQLEAQIEPEHCEVLLDVEKMMRVLQNLFENARKYAVKGSVVHFHVYQNEKEVVLELQNETSGMHPEDMDRLFERFYKGDTSRSETDSSGLGLSIVKRIVELHEGKIKAIKDGTRICFQITLTCS